MASASMLLVSIMTLSSATYAWFTMNKTVTVDGMKLKATAEDGLVISDSTKTNWATSWDVNMATAATLAPTSNYANAATAATTFVTNKSDLFDNAKANQAADYVDLGTLDWSDQTANSGSIGSKTTGTTPNAVTTNYVLKRTFYIKATGDQAWAKNLVIDEVKAEVDGDSAATSENLDKALRVLVVVNDVDAFVYAPITGATTSYNWKGTMTGAQAVTTVASTTDSTCTNVASIPIVDANAVKVDMYMYFEGEDANCKSSNISNISVDTLKVSAKFKTTAGPADA